MQRGNSCEAMISLMEWESGDTGPANQAPVQSQWHNAM